MFQLFFGWLRSSFLIKEVTTIMPVPQTLLDAVSKLQGDADNLAVVTADANDKQAAADAAKKAADDAAAVVTEAKALVEQSRSDLHKLIDDTYVV